MGSQSASLAEGTGATAWGRKAQATGDYSTAWGFNTEAINDKSTAFGDNTIAGGKIATSGHMQVTMFLLKKKEMDVTTL